MNKMEIKKLDDKDLQLRYFLGGLKNINDNKDHLCDYWTCDINCSCSPVPDDEKLDTVKKFIKKHNITNERFLKLSYNYLIGAIMKYNGFYSNLFFELESVLKPYNFVKTNKYKILDNDFREEKLKKLVFNINDSNSIIGEFIKKYNLTINDFIILAKTSINHNIYSLCVSNHEDTFIKELIDIINKYELNATKDQIVQYREEYKHKQETAELILEIKSIQKKYLEFMKKLLNVDPNLATKIINEELNELGFNTRKDIKKLINVKEQKDHL